MRRLALGFLCILLLATTISAQSEKANKPAKKAAHQAGMAMPKPAPELKRLAYFLGDWTTEGTLQSGPFGPGGAFTGKDHTEWYPGRFFVVTRTDMTMGGMAMKGMDIFGYDREKKVYTYHGINSMGQEENSTGTVNGADWTWNNDEAIEGKTYKTKFTVHEDSPTSYSMKMELSPDGGKTWQTALEGKATKTEKPATAPK